MKKMCALVLALAMPLTLMACSPSTDSGSSADETIDLVLWGAEEDQDFLAERVKAFQEVYPDKKFDIRIGVESESSAKDTVLTDVESAADVFAFADDQLSDLVDAGALLELGEISEALEVYAGKSIDDVKAANVPASIDDATRGDGLYAFPLSADNGYFLYYDSTVFTEKDIQTWDGMLAAAEAKGNGRKVAFPFASGWYNSGFFYGAGFTTDRNEDGTTAIDWNQTSPQGVTGVQVTQAMLNIASHPAFMAISDSDAANQIAAGNLCAVVSGTWDASTAEKYFGEGYAATVLPTYTVDGKQVHTGSVTGCKLIGVNAYSEWAGWAVLLADFITNEESQMIHYQQRQIGPSNIKAQNSDEVAANVAISAVLAQNEFAVIQRVGGKFWDPVATFGEKIAQNKIPSDDASVQAALDELVEGVIAPLN